jgi:hypothetical protein
MEPVISFSCLQEPANGLCTEPDESSPQLSNLLVFL